MDDSPRPISRRQLEQIVRGLQTRFSSSAQAVLADVQRLSAEQAQVEASLTEELSELEQLRRTQREATTQEWDERLMARWDDAEMRSYKAVYDTAHRQGLLRRDARKQVEELTAELKRRANDLEKAFLRAKDTPLARLNDVRQQAQAFSDELTTIQQATETILIQRSLTPPQVAAVAIPHPTPQTAQAAQSEVRRLIDEARAVGERLANHPTAKFFESPTWWAVCALLFSVVTAGLGLSGAVNWLAATLAGAVVMVTVLLLSLIAIRPWLKQQAAAEYPRFQGLIQLARGLVDETVRLAVCENDAELKRLAARRDQQFEQAKQTREQQAARLTETLEGELSQLASAAVAEKRLASQQLTQAIAECDTTYSQRLQTEWQQFSERREKLTAISGERSRQLDHQMEALQRGGAERQQLALHTARQLLSRSQKWCQQYFPAWPQLLSNEAHWPQALPRPLLSLGSLALDSVLPEEVRPVGDPSHLQAPLLFSPLDDGYLTITLDPSSPLAAHLVRNLVMRALTTLPAGRAQVCVIDPPGLGRDFGWLMHLGDFDPQLVWHRVWTQPGHISKQLADLALAAEDFIQQSLRNQYRDIVEFNAEAGALAEPYRILVWSSFPLGLDDHSAKHLRSLLDTGARCGIIPILLIDPNSSWPIPELRELVQRRGLHLHLDAASRTLRTSTPPLSQLALILEHAADEEQASAIVQSVGRRGLLASRVEVPLATMLPTADSRWLGDSSHALEIPIGQSGVGRVQSLKLGLGTAQHAILAGKTGSGKSSLLHAIITSAALKYSPNQLRMVLLDFKKGVEFQVYAEVALPHADIIGIESHREFGLSALEYVDACMQRRGEAFRREAVQDLASWNQRHPEQPMPRMLFMVDEFQELFVEDDKLASQASLILDRIVRQGRSFGVHAILSSQTLAGAYSLPRTTLGQMAVRIALQCDTSDAQLIFADDNPAAQRLKFPGQAIYNDAGGRIEGNQPMQVGWLTKPQQISWLSQLPSGYLNQDPTTNRLGRCVVFDGNRTANWDPTNAQLALAQARTEVNPEAVWCLVGESVAISPAVVFPLTMQAGRNMLLVGGEDQLAATVLTAIAASWSSTQGQISRPQIFVVQGAKPTDAWVQKLPQLWRDLPCDLQCVDMRGADKLLKSAHELLQSRIAQIDSSSDSASHLPQVAPPPILLCILQLGRLRSLRRDDDFGMGGFGETELKPDKLLEELLRDGPGHGLHTIVWAENYSTVQRWLSRTALRELEIRLLMRMSGSDSTNLIDSIAASRLGEQVMLVYDEATGQEQKFRPFGTAALENIIAWKPN